MIGRIGIEMSVLFFVAALLALLLIAGFFIVCRRYEDGLVGNLALLAIVLTSACGLADAWRGVLELPSPTFCVLIEAGAVFLLRHAYRFAMFHWHGKYGWLRPRDALAKGDPEATQPMRRGLA